MAEVRAFRGIRYRMEVPEEAGAAIAPPYDVIAPDEQETLLARSPHNVVRLELPRDEPGDDTGNNRYTRAARLFQEWLASGVLDQDPQPCLYVYGQRYEAPDGEQERLGLIGALKVEPFEAGVVLPHEQTFLKHKEDRYRLLTAARAQFSPIFGLYSAPETDVRERLARVAGGTPAALAVDREGVMHRLWPVSDPDFIRWIEEVFAGKQVFIADGHHRYETALRYRDERRGGAAGGAASTHESLPEAYDYVMTFLVEMDDPGLVLLPTHRLVRGGLPEPEELRRKLEQCFQVQEVPLADADTLRHHQLGVVLPDGGAWRLTLADRSALERLDGGHGPAWRDLDVVLLHHLVFREILGIGKEGEIVYTRDPGEARSRVLGGEFRASFLLPPPRVDELKAVAGAGDRMPEKSTYFWPKAVTGLVIYGE
jgi:uncharacterized protein (DUF1015 family)